MNKNAEISKLARSNIRPYIELYNFNKLDKIYSNAQIYSQTLQ